jgi:hypothetical protein
MADQTPQVMEDADWDSLAWSVATGGTILMLGPDVCTEMVDGQRQPVLNRLSTELMKLTSDPGLFEPDDFRAVAQAVVAKDLIALQRTAVTTLRNVTLDAPALEQLASLPFRVVINTAPGIEVEKVWRTKKGDTNSRYYDFRPRRSLEAVPEPTTDAPLIYHLYGSLSDPPSLTLTESDLIELLVAVVSENPDLPSNLKSELRSEQHTYLFLGFRMHLWHLRILLHALAAADPQAQSYALQGVAPVDAGTQQFYRHDHKVKFCDISPDEFVAELATRVAPMVPESDGSTSAATRSEPNSAHQRSTVFLCHANADKPYVDELRIKLEAAGFDPWFDKEDLGGGDIWDPKIENAIKTVDYFIVIQSDALVNRKEGYVNKEIKLALDRQDYFDPDTERFIIPVIIDDEANSLSRLSEIQSVKLYEPDGIDRLLQTLQRDRERSAKKPRTSG